MYDLQSLKLTEAQAKLKKFERNVHSAEAEAKSMSLKKTQLEAQLEKVSFYTWLKIGVRLARKQSLDSRRRQQSECLSF